MDKPNSLKNPSGIKSFIIALNPNLPYAVSLATTFSCDDVYMHERKPVAGPQPHALLATAIGLHFYI